MPFELEGLHEERDALRNAKSITTILTYALPVLALLPDLALRGTSLLEEEKESAGRCSRGGPDVI
jgi:hypothetical protein